MCGHIHGTTLQRVWQELARRAAEVSRESTVRAGTAQRERLRRSLALAWGTEYFLATNYLYAREEELVRITNSWAVVQAYYVHYHAFAALLAAQGRDAPARHDKLQAMFASEWAGRRQQLPPCSFGFGSKGPVNLPSGLEFDTGLHGWSRCDDRTCWSIASIALRTTRGEAIAERMRRNRERKQRERRQEWLSQESARLAGGRRPRKEPAFPLPRLTSEEARRVRQTERDYTLMDYLYRLRVKANYLDSAMFLDGPEDDRQSRGLLRTCGTSRVTLSSYTRFTSVVSLEGRGSFGSLTNG
jgi:hypothetical protein